MITHRARIGGAALVALAVLFVGLTILFNHALRGWRLDLTQNKLYTIAPGTERILASLAEPVSLYFFYSPRATDQFPALRTYATRVQEFLEELAARSNGKLRLTVIDPLPFSEDEDRAAELGVRAVPVGGSGGALYFGLAGTNSTDGRSVIDFFDPGKEAFLEYDVAKLIHGLASPRKPVLGLLSGLPMTAGFDPMTGRMREPWVVMSQAEQLFTVRSLGHELTAIDADVDLLMLVHPQDLPQSTLFAIDQFALRGGRILLFVDPLSEADDAGAEPGNPLAAMGADKSSRLAPLLAAWGVEFDPGQVVGDLQHALTVAMRPGEPPVRHLGILGLPKESLSETDIVTAGLSDVNVVTAGHLRPREGAPVGFEPLLRSSEQAALIPAERFAMLFDPATLRDGFAPSGERYVLAARISGTVRSAFPDGAPEGVALPESAEPLAESTEPLNLIVFADTDLLADYLWVRQQSFFGQRVWQAWANNGDLVLNAIDNLAGSGDLISVRGRATFTRPFDRVEALRIAAEDRFRAKEQELEQQLQATEEQLTKLQSQRSDQGALILTADQEQALARFQQEKLRIRKELRDVRLGLDQDIRRLGNTLKLVNIVIVPALLALLALLVVVFRKRRRAAIVLLQQEAGS